MKRHDGDQPGRVVCVCGTDGVLPGSDNEGILGCGWCFGTATAEPHECFLEVGLFLFRHDLYSRLGLHRGFAIKQNLRGRVQDKEKIMPDRDRGLKATHCMRIAVATISTRAERNMFSPPQFRDQIYPAPANLPLVRPASASSHSFPGNRLCSELLEDWYFIRPSWW